MSIPEVKHKDHYLLHPYQKGPVSLSVLIEDESISAAIFSKDHEQLHEISSLTFAGSKIPHSNNINEFSFFLKDFDILKHTYSEVNIQILNRLFTLIPNAFANSQTKSLLEFNLGLSDIKAVHQTLINKTVNFAFTGDFELFSFIERTFNTAKIQHAGAVSIDLFLKLPALKNSDVFLNIHHHLIELMVKKDNDLIFYNVYQWDSNEDILYFLLFTIEQFQLNQNSLQLSIASLLSAGHPLFTLMKKYIRHIQFFSSKAIDKPIENLPNHYFFNVLNSHLCEL